LFLEDAHWMDPASPEALRYLLPRLAEARLLAVMTLRTEELTGQQAAALAALENTHLPRRLDLARLNLDETGELVRQARDLEQAVPRFSARLYTESVGMAGTGDVFAAALRASLQPGQPSGGLKVDRCPSPTWAHWHQSVPSSST
jgi:pyridoxal/pyridoxine/pyridoxamine kinase